MFLIYCLVAAFVFSASMAIAAYYGFFKDPSR